MKNGMTEIRTGGSCGLQDGLDMVRGRWGVEKRAGSGWAGGWTDARWDDGRLAEFGIAAGMKDEG